MNSSTAIENIKATLSGQNAPRAILVSLDQNGQLQQQLVANDESILNIHTELIDHLDASPRSTEFLVALRDYATGRLAARAEAKATGGVSMPRPGGWDIVHVMAQVVQ